jgi:type IV pilus assembly protein PilY1
VLTGTGDREKPLMTSTNDNFAMLKDTLLGQADRADPASLSDLLKIAHVDNATFELKPDNAGATNPNGCYIQLSTKGEKVVNAPFSIAGVTYFGTNRPTPSEHSCTASLGEARAYQFPLFCGMPSNTLLATGGMPPSPVGGLVQISKPDGTTALVPFVIGSGTNNDHSPLGADRPRPAVPFKPKRTYWHLNDGNR